MGADRSAALDRDWDQPGQREEALGVVLRVLQAVEAWVQTLPQDEAELAEPSLDIARRVKEQDVQVDEKGKAHLIKGVAKDRRISIEDAEMRMDARVAVCEWMDTICTCWLVPSCFKLNFRRLLDLSTGSLEVSVLGNS